MQELQLPFSFFKNQTHWATLWYIIAVSHQMSSLSITVVFIDLALFKCWLKSGLATCAIIAQPYFANVCLYQCFFSLNLKSCYWNQIPDLDIFDRISSIQCDFPKLVVFFEIFNKVGIMFSVYYMKKEICQHFMLHLSCLTALWIISQMLNIITGCWKDSC